MQMTYKVGAQESRLTVNKPKFDDLLRRFLQAKPAPRFTVKTTKGRKDSRAFHRRSRKVTDMPILQLRSELALHTRCENQVTNEINREQVRAGDVLQVQAFNTKYRDAIHRPVGPSRKYNCHGLTFASRRTWIHEAQEVRKILSDDEYEKIAPPEVIMPGDIAVYFKDGDIEHSGIVVGISPGELRVPIILSKWGACHEVVHRVYESEYDSRNVGYYRIKT